MRHNHELISGFDSILLFSESYIKQYIKANIFPTPNEHGSGGTLETFSIHGNQDIVVKRIKLNGHIVRLCGGDMAKTVKRLKEEHQFVDSYLHGFTPKTIFLEIDLGNGNEWVMVQERVSGIEFLDLEDSFIDPSKISVKFKERFRELVFKYRLMRIAGRVPENQVLIDFVKNNIWFYDTNFLSLRDDALKAESIFVLLNDRPKSSRAEDIWAFLQRNFVATQKLNIKRQSEFLESIKMPGATYLAIVEEIKQMPPQYEISYNQLFAIQDICRGLTYFPPNYFDYNIFTLRLAKALQLFSH